MQDLFTIKKISRELNGIIKGAKVNKVLQPLSEEIDLVLYNGKSFRLILSAKPSLARVSISNKEKENPTVAPNFCMLLRKHLTGAEVTGVDVAFNDRIIAVTLQNKTELLDDKTFTLYAEIMGKHSNVFLVENGVILGALKQTPQGLDDKRLTLAGAPYIPPQKPEKLSVTHENVRGVLSSFSGGDLKWFLLNSFYEFSPVTAGELAFELESKGLTEQNFFNFIEKPLNPVVITNGASVDFYPFDYATVSGERQSYESLVLAQESVYSSKEDGENFKSKLNAVLSPLTNHRKKVVKKLNLATEVLTATSDAEKLKLYGELITCNLYMLKKGQTTAKLINYGEVTEEITVPLDGLLTPQENAKKYFKQYRKKKTAIEIAFKQYEELSAELSYLDSALWYLESATTTEEILEVKRELIDAKIIKDNTPKKKKKDLPLKPLTYNVLGYTLKVGKNNLQNEYLYNNTSRLDLWFHVKNYPSSHVYVLAQASEVPSEVILVASEICAFRSKGSGGGKIEVDYTLRKHLKKHPNGKPGSVTYTDFKTILVEPNGHLDLIEKTDL